MRLRTPSCQAKHPYQRKEEMGCDEEEKKKERAKRAAMLKRAKCLRGVLGSGRDEGAPNLEKCKESR